jgi:hypothetical protein
MKRDYIKYQDRVLEQMRDFPPEVKVKLAKIRLIREKADREEGLHKLVRALERYKYILKLYLSIPKEIVDLADDVTNVKQKIAQLENKI